ncbi:MAG: hypothetical protein AB7D43_04670 [Sulfurimonadaceae bacterium]
MLKKIIDDKKFASLMQKNIEETLMFLFEKEEQFGILCKISDVTFDPELPHAMLSEFRSLTLFLLAGYTFETAHIADDCLVFEAGFGDENFGSVVSVPLLSILQVLVDDTPILINLATYKKEQRSKEKVDNKGVENSMKSFLSNPENSKFFKK